MEHIPTRHWNYVPLADILDARPARATIDFETRSACPLGGQKGRGAWLYSKHRSTRVLCLAFTLPGQCPLRPSLWAPPMGGNPAVEDYELDEHGEPYSIERLFQYIRDGGLVEAHNVFFEAMIWQNLFVKPEAYDEGGCKGIDAPPVKDEQWRDSAAKAAALALPRDLAGAGDAMDLPRHLRKWADVGNRILNKVSKPRKAKKGEDKVDWLGEPVIYWHAYDSDDFATLYAYCKQDVVSEHALSEVTPDLPDREYRVWLADFRANRRGVRIDVDLVRMAIKLEAQLKRQMNDTLEGITRTDEDGEYPEGIRGSERAKVLAWLADRGVDLPDSQAATLDHLMASSFFDSLDGDVQTVLKIFRNINRASVSKFKRILDCLDPDDNRVRELVMYHGAATGRWSGKGIQVQNFPKGNLAEMLGVPGNSPNASMRHAVADVMTGDVGWLQCLYGDPLSVLSSVVRGAIIPTPGKVLYVADYAAIEARVVLWLAGAIKALDVFKRKDTDIYCDMASGIYRRPIIKGVDTKERAFGKVAVLGLGYGMGWLTFLITLRTYKIKFTDADARAVLGDKAEKYIGWIKKQLWPERPDELDFKDDEEWREAMRKWKNAKKTAGGNLRRLRDEREIPEEMIAEMALCKYTVDTYRTRYPEVKKLWRLQEDAACRAVAVWKRRKIAREEAFEVARLKAKRLASEGKPFYYEEPDEESPVFVECGHVTWFVEGRWLWCVLPSGRRLAYNLPDVKSVATPWGDKRLSLRFWGVHKKSKKWARMSSYGGSIVENIDQGTARDMMADALVRIDSGYDSEYDFDLLASIHDEAVAEGEVDGLEQEHEEEYRGLMTKLEPCYAGCPVAAEGEPLWRYQKG